MLSDLKVDNFAIIDQIAISLPEGLVILTGETGAGKSVIIGALNLILGGRASSEWIRTDESEACVEAGFDLTGHGALAGRLAEMGLPAEETCVVKRVVTRQGRNKVFVNGSLATMAMLAGIGEDLINVYGQHEHQKLLRTAMHMDLLDEYGALATLRGEVATAHGALGRVEGELAKLAALEKDKALRQDMLAFQSKEIESARVEESEDEALEQEARILRNAETLFESSDAVEKALYSSDDAVLGRLGTVVKRLGEIAALDGSVNESLATIESAVNDIEDVAYTLRDYRDGIPFDSARLEEIDARLQVLRALKRKYGPALSDVLARFGQIRTELEEITSSEERLKGLEEERARCRQRLTGLGAKLGKARKKVAARLEKGVEKELAFPSLISCYNQQICYFSMSQRMIWTYLR